MKFTPYEIPLLLAALILGMLGWYGRRFRNAPAALPFTISVWLAAVWALVYALDISTSDLTTKLLLFKLRYLVIPWLPVATVALAIEFIGQGKKLTPRILAGLSIIPAITTALALTSDFQTFFRNGSIVDISGPFPVLLLKSGPWFWVYIIFTDATILTAWGMLFRASRTSHHPYRQQALALIIGTFIPLALDACYNLGITPLPDYNIAPSFLVLTGLIYVWALFRYQMLDVIPIARSTVLENISDAVLVLDTQDRLVDFNPAAQKLFGGTTLDIGQPVEGVLSQWPVLLADYRQGAANGGLDNHGHEIYLGNAEPRKFYDLSITPIKRGSPPSGKGDQLIGHLIFLRDITERKWAEVEIQRLAKFPKENPNPILRAAQDGMILYANPASQSILDGWQCQVGQPLPDQLRITILEILKLGTSKTIEITSNNRAYSLTVAPIAEEGYVNLYCLDITERKQAEKALRESEERYRNLADLLPQIIFETDWRGKITYTNQRGLTVTGYTPEEFEQGLNAVQMVIPEDQARIQAVMQRLLAGASSFGEEYTALRKDGTTFPVLIYSTPILRGAQVRGTRGLIVDITERKQVEEALRESEEKLRQITSSMREAVWLRDTRSLALLYVNPAYETIWGRSCESFYQNPTSFFDAVHPEDKEQVQQAIKNQYQGIFFNEEYRIVRPDGSVRWIWGQTFPIKNEAGEVYRVTAVAEDITERKQMQHTLANYADEMEALYKTSLEINSQSETAQLLQTITSRAAQLVNAQMGGLYLMAPDNNTLELVVSYNLPGDWVGTRLRVGEGLSGLVAESGEPIMVEDYRVWEKHAVVYKDSPFRRVLGVPLKWGSKIIGVINVTDDVKTGRFTEDEVRLVTLFADQAAIAIQNSRLFAETTRRAEQLEALNHIGQAVTSDLDLDQVLKTLSEQCQQVLPVDAFYVAVYDQDTGLIHHPLVYDRGEYYHHSPRDIYTMPGLGGEVIDGRKTLYVPDMLNPNIIRMQRATRILGTPIRSYVGVPLIMRDRVVGVLAMQNYQPNAYTPEQIHLLETIATQAAIAVENANLFEQMKQFAITDSLTQMFNRRHFFDLANIEVERAKRYNRPLAVIMMDIDDFKKTNDDHGHAMGDRILQAFADQCRLTLRTVDILGRYGGEEFVVVLPETPIGHARAAAERLRQAVEALAVETPQGIAKIYVSLGVAALGSEHTDLDALLSCADRALYIAKERGKNQVVVCTKQALENEKSAGHE